MTASGLRREAQRGHLVIERIAGKDYTTLNAIEEMRALCRVEGRGHGFGCADPSTIKRAGSPTRQYGSSKTENTDRALDAALMIVEALKQRSQTISPPSTSPKRNPASVHRLTSRSPTP
jgi:hypothetical protein